MPETYGYVRTSRPRVSELAGSDPETQRQQLLAAGVALSHIYQDVGVSAFVYVLYKIQLRGSNY